MKSEKIVERAALQHQAWLLPVAQRCQLLAAEVLEYLPEVALDVVPTSVGYCRQVCLWQGQLVPVLNFSHWLDGDSRLPARARVAVLAYRGRGGEPQLLAIHLLCEPELFSLSDEGFNAELQGLPDSIKPFVITQVVSDERRLLALDFANLMADSPLSECA